MMRVTNTGAAPLGVWVGGAVKFVYPGEARELSLTGRELEEAKTYEALTFEAVEEPAKPTKADKAK